MVWPDYQNLEIDFWLHHGRLGLAQPSLCVYHETASKGSQFLTALHELSAHDRPAKFTLTFARSARKAALGKLTLSLLNESEELKVLSIRHDGAAAAIDMTDIGHALLIKAISSWLAGAEDFGVSPRHAKRRLRDLGRLDRQAVELWFWGPGYYGP